MEIGINVNNFEYTYICKKKEKRERIILKNKAHLLRKSKDLSLTSEPTLVSAYMFESNQNLLPGD